MRIEGAIAADEPSEAGRAASALCAHRRPEGLKWRAHEAKRSAQSKAAKRLEARGAHEARALWAKQRVVSPMRQGAPQASLRAMRNDHAELWPRPKGVRSAGTPRRRRRERCEDTEHRASVSAGRCEDAERPLRIEGVAVAREQTLPPPACQKDFFDKRIFPSPRSCFSGSIQARAMLPAPRWMPSTGPMWRISALRPRSRK